MSFAYDLFMGCPFLVGNGERLERRSPDGDTQNLANTNGPTTPPLCDGYGTIDICQGSCLEETVTNTSKAK